MIGRQLLVFVTTVALLCGWAVGNEMEISTKDRQQCVGMYSKKDWGGDGDAYIDLALEPAADDKHGWVAVVIFEYRDVDLLGAGIPGDKNVKYVCDEGAVASNMCDKEQIGEFILSKSANKTSYAHMVTKKVDIQKPEAVRYELKKSGFYCVSSASSPHVKYKGVALFHNAFGDLSASQIPKLPFYGGMALAYLVVFALWMFAYIQHRQDILPVQNYITAICGFLVVEMVIIWGYYDYVNNGAGKVGSMVYLGLLSVLNAFRNAFTFFLLLIVSMGYSVVKPSLGDAMWKCRALAGAHFFFAVVYTVSSYIVPPEEAGPIIMLVIMPLSLTMTTFYVWILASLTSTIKYLDSNKQYIKARMYKTLWMILLGSMIVIFGFFFINSMIFAGQSNMEFITNHWKARWFLLDGWINVVYIVDFTLIAFIWRPSANNRRFAMSTQISQDENDAQEFEIGSLRESLDDEESIGAQRRREEESDEEFVNHVASLPAFQQSDPPSYEETEGSGATPTNQKKSTNTKDVTQDASSSTMFAVGDDDSDEDNNEDRQQHRPTSHDEDRWDDDDEQGLLNKGTSHKKDD
jgi:hypothetical protein